MGKVRCVKGMLKGGDRMGNGLRTSQAVTYLQKSWGVTAGK